ncbi:MAG: prepilin-type N-terminal cleavage/methylation domain-containing protein, partial [Actinobacteria bacterium]|nr:prepilin-type N-terminal cleavage/methylation domain-containing protein [Actinomycetota bacterium]
MSIMRVAQLLRSPQRAFSKEDGFSLMEVMAALFIFTLLTLGLVPLLTSSIRGSNTARADTIGKNAALKAMERVRGLPFYVSYATSTTKVDLLDLYYPDAATDTVEGGITFYRTVCPWNAVANPACPRDIPPDYTITFEAQFVDPVASGPQPTPGETATSYANVAPPATYSWASATTDTPPRQIVQM